MTYLINFWKFSRPHTIIGTTLSVFSLYAIALITMGNQISLAHGGQLLGTWLACCCGNIYIVGLNQLEDIAIDRINKPHLPLAAGEFSPRQGQWIVGTAGLLAIALAAILGYWLLAVVAISLAIGTAYSFPPLRLKRFPFLAAFCILTVRGVIVNLGLFLHFNGVLGGLMGIEPAVWLLTLFILVFTIAIAIFKDVPDLEGDRQYQIATFTVLLGQQTVFDLALWIVTACYLGTISAAIWQLPGVNPWTLVSTHCVLLALFWWRSRAVSLDDKAAIAQFYQFIWKLFFLEYLIFPLACWF